MESKSEEENKKENEKKPSRFKKFAQANPLSGDIIQFTFDFFTFVVVNGSVVSRITGIPSIEDHHISIYAIAEVMDRFPKFLFYGNVPFTNPIFHAEQGINEQLFISTTYFILSTIWDLIAGRPALETVELNLIRGASVAPLNILRSALLGTLGDI